MGRKSRKIVNLHKALSHSLLQVSTFISHFTGRKILAKIARILAKIHCDRGFAALR
jgi:hypothetical protein